MYHALALRAMKALLEGRLDDVEPLAREAHATFQRFGPSPRGAAVLAMQLVLLRREQGRLAEAAPAFRAWAAVAPPHPLKRPFLALLAAELDEMDEARRHLDELGTGGFAGIPHNAHLLAVAALLAEVCVTVGDVGHGQALYAHLLPRAAMNVFPDGSWYFLGSASRYLGLLAAMFARRGVAGPGWDAVARHFEDALAMHEQIGARPMLAHTAREYAAMLITRGHRGDAACAGELLHRALAIYQDLGMKVHANRITPLLHHAPAAALPPPVPAYPDGLTAREVEVLRLVAAGKGNREIAAALVISHYTVERHVNHPFAKTGAANRVELAAYAGRHGLAE